MPTLVASDCAHHETGNALREAEGNPAFDALTIHVSADPGAESPRAQVHAYASVREIPWLSSLQRQAEQDGFINTEEIDALLGEDAILAGALDGGAPGGIGGGGGDGIGADSDVAIED